MNRKPPSLLFSEELVKELITRVQSAQVINLYSGGLMIENRKLGVFLIVHVLDLTSIKSGWVPDRTGAAVSGFSGVFRTLLDQSTVCQALCSF